ncbi:MAG TPA: DNA primase [Patescibacteria group bacterium]|nr:DNA primase [Patescibacteria group bacterium]
MSDSQVDEIKNRLDVVEIIQEYLPSLKQVGGNWKGLCPFHNEKTPSFMVSKEKQIWHCFGCGEGGDIFTFVMKFENLEFPEALKILAKKAGVILKYEEPRLMDQKTKILDILEIASKFYHNLLLNSAEAGTARKYIFEKRQLKKETVEDFSLGFSLDSWDSLLKFLREKKYNENDIFLSGLAIKKERGSGFYDRFRGRIMFPIRDVHGHVVGFTARLLPEAEKKENAGGKYINTPQTLVYNKSQVIYGLNDAKQNIKKENLTVMVEGNMDVIASHEAGIKNVVASSGTAMTVEQVNLLKRFSPNLAISFDADLAGGVAAMRGIDVALREGVAVKVIMLDPNIGKDPDDYIRKDVNLWREAIANAMPFMDYYIKKVLSTLDLRKIEHKKEAARLLLTELNKIPDKVEQAYYLEKLGNILGVSEQILRESMPREKLYKNEDYFEEKSRFSITDKSRPVLLAETFLALLLKYPSCLNYAIDYIEPFMLPEPMFGEIYKNLILSYNKAVDSGSLESVVDNISKDDKTKNYINSLYFLAERDFDGFEEEAIKEEVVKSAKALKTNYIFSQRKRLEAEMRKAEEKGDQETMKKLMSEFDQSVALE